MRKILIVAALMLAVGCKKKKDDPAPTPRPDPKIIAEPKAPEPAVDPALVERGRYLTNLAACGLCHTPMGPQGPDFKRAFAGGMEVPETFGTWRAPNITPDKGTGIGGWTDDQILAAVREGVRPDGSHLYPIMAYPYYNRMTDADGKALVAFLRSLPPIENVVAPTKDLKLPQPPVPKPTNEADVVDDPVKHGEYLATLAHCHMCHTPMTDKGPDMAKSFAGGFPMESPMLGEGKLFSANISSDPETGIGKWTVEQVAASIKTMKKADGTMIVGPMLFYQAGWAQLDDKDINAIAAYIKQLPPVKNKVPKSTFKPNPKMFPPPPEAGAPAGGSAPPDGAAKPGGDMKGGAGHM